MWARLGLLWSLTQVACTPSGVFVCSLDTECSGGSCESTGFCSFSDVACASGRRYGALSGNGLAGICVGEEPDASPGQPDASSADASSLPDGGTPGACGTMDLLVDNFDDGIRGPQWGYSFSNGGTATETGGRLVITLVTANGSNYSGYATELTYDMTGRGVRLEIVTAPNAATSAQGVLRVHDVPNVAGMTFEVSGGMLQFIRNDSSGGQTAMGNVPFDPVAHRYWQLREQGGQIFWETSPDQAAWTVRRQAASPFDVKWSRVTLFGGTYENQASPGQVAFDNFNAGAAAGAFCPPETLNDRFEDGELGVAWSRAFTDVGCVVDETGGVLTLTPTATAGSGCQVGTSTAYNLTGKSVLVRVPQMVATGADILAYMRLADFAAGPSHYVAFFQRGGMLLAQSRTGGSETDVATPWNATDHRWWRIREAGGMVFWETSPDAASWTIRRMAASPIALTQIVVDLSVENGVGAASPGAAHFDDLNAPP